MKAIIEFDQSEKYLRLLHAFHAVHNSLTHDRDIIMLQQGKAEFILSTVENYLQIGEIGSSRESSYWTNNVNFNQIELLYANFVWGRYDRIHSYPRWKSSYVDLTGVLPTGDVPRDDAESYWKMIFAEY